jgi:cell division transport system ATP-binding protein
LAIARAISHRPELLLCDEPTGNLDAATTFGVMRTLNRVSMIGTTVLCVTHDPQMVDLMQKRVIAIRDGVVASDSVGGYRLG